MSDCLYHYCNIEVFKAIISKKNIRLSDLSKTNDYMERKWILNLIEGGLNEFFMEEKVDINLRDPYAVGDEALTYLRFLFNEIKIHVEQSSFISSFSRKGDLLNQWRAYANDGRGVSIGFDQELLSQINHGDSAIEIESVLYDRSEQIEEIKRAAKVALEKIRKADGSVEMEADFKQFSDEFSSIISVISNYIKNPAFMEEDEVRIFYAPFIHESTKVEELAKLMSSRREFNEFILNPIDFYVRNHQMVGFSDVSFKKLIKKGIISEVVIGPSSKIREKDIELLMIKYGYNITDLKIRRSDSTYQIK